MRGRAPVSGHLRQQVALVFLQLSPWCSAGRPQLNRCVEQLQVLIFHLGAPAAPRVYHHGQAHHVASHIHMQGQLVREVRLHQGALWKMGGVGVVRELPSSAAPPYKCISILQKPSPTSRSLGPSLTAAVQFLRAPQEGFRRLGTLSQAGMRMQAVLISDLPLGQRKTHGHHLLNHHVSQAALGPGPCRGH